MLSRNPIEGAAIGVLVGFSMALGWWLLLMAYDLLGTLFRMCLLLIAAAATQKRARNH